MKSSHLCTVDVDKELMAAQQFYKFWDNIVCHTVAIRGIAINKKNGEGRHQKKKQGFVLGQSGDR